MFNVGGPEVVVILIVALLILGPEQLPKAMRTFGQVMAEIRKVSGGFQDEMRRAMEEVDPCKVIEKAAGSPSSTVTTTEDGTEVVARNPEHEPGDDSHGLDDAGPGATAGPDAPGAPSGPDDDGPPPISPADRAAG